MALGQKKPADHISRYKTLAIRDEQTGTIIGYRNNPEYVSTMPFDPMDNLKFACTKYPERVYDDVFCEYKGDKGMGACEDCQYLVTINNAHGNCEHEQIIYGEDSICVLSNRRVCFEECLDCPSFEQYTGKKILRAKPTTEKTICVQTVNRTIDNSRINKPCPYKVNGECGNCGGLVHINSKEPVVKKPVEPLTDLELLDIIGETGLEIS
jgi:hypothetical protein